jgi:hypothetical protein
MQITFNLPSVFYPGSDKVQDAQALKALVGLLVELNVAYLLAMKRVAHTVPRLYTSGVRYDRTVWWETIPALYNRTYGDCKSLTGAFVAEMLLRKIPCKPVFRWIERPNGLKDYHILVGMPDGSFEDPSKRLGMPDNEVRQFYGPGSY